MINLDKRSKFLESQKSIFFIQFPSYDTVNKASESLKNMYARIRSPISNKIIQLFILVIILLITILSLFRLYKVTIDQLTAPHDIIFESYNLATIKSIQSGEPIYSPDYYGDLPFIITIYNPLFHYLVAILPQNEKNPFLTGRCVSLAATLLVALLIFLPGDFRKNKMIPFLYIGCFFLIHETVKHAAYLNNNTMALFLAALAVVCIEKSCGKKSLIVLSSILCFLAFITKQSYLSATATCFIFLLFRARRDALIFLIISIIIYGSFALFVQTLWGSGYWFSVYISSLRYPKSLHLLLSQWRKMLQQPVFTFLVLTTISSMIYATIKQKFQAIKNSPYLYYLFASFLILTATLGKIGSSNVYFLEFIVACLLWNVFFIRSFSLNFYSSLKRMSPLVLLYAIVLFELTHAERLSYSFTDQGSI